MNEEQTLLRDSALAFLTGEMPSAGAKTPPSTEDNWDRVLWTKMAALGWMSLRLPEDQGGAGLGLAEAAVLTRVFGEKAFGSPFILGCLQPSAVLAAAVGNAKADGLAERLISGDTPISVAAGSARLASRDGRLEGLVRVHRHAPGGPLLLWTDYKGEDAIIAVETSDLRRTSQGVTLSNCEIAADDILLTGPAAANAWARAHQEALIALCAQLTGLARVAIDLTADYARQRVQFERPIASFQVVQHKIVNLTIDLQLAESSYQAALRTLDGGSEAAQAAVHAAKARCSDCAMDAARAGIQLHGAIGFTDECALTPYVRSAMDLSQLFGNAAYHRQQHWQLAMQGGQDID